MEKFRYEWKLPNIHVAHNQVDPNCGPRGESGITIGEIYSYTYIYVGENFTIFFSRMAKPKHFKFM
jgi:hypothetical protein